MNLETLLSDTEPRIDAIELEMSQPEVLNDTKKMTELAREHRRLSDLRNLHTQLKDLLDDLESLRDALTDPELAELAQAELTEKEAALADLESNIKLKLVPEAPEDSRNAVLEIRAGTGGDEAALFAGDLHKMYTRYFELRGWGVKVIDGHFSDLGGVRELTINVTGDGVYGKLKWESGVHRVQRVPTTETSGRLHTSAATVAVLPEAEDVDVEIDPKDLKIDTYRSSGPGGQHVNKTDSAIRITHLPTNVVVTCQDEKSQYKNKVQAMKVLRARLYKAALDAEQEKRAAQRRSQVSSGDRSAKIRTYNYPQNRVTDHRVPVSIYRLDEILNGALQIITNPVAEFFATESLAEVLKVE